MSPLLIRNAIVDGQADLDLKICDGVIVEIGRGLRGRGPEIDAAGGAVIPGLADHHIHLLACAAARQSLDLSDESICSESGLVRALRAADAASPRGCWIRGVGYSEAIAGALSCERLDAWLPSRPIRVQYATGSLWVLNSAALREVLRGDPPPDCVERDASGAPTGRIWRGDAWLRERVSPQSLNLSMIGAALARAGVTHLCDASATTDASSAALLADAVRCGALPQRLMLMSGGQLEAPPDGAFEVGAVKIILDEANIPDLDTICARVASARRWGRNVAFHCVTAVELAFAFAVLEEARVRSGDRIEHGGVVDTDSAIRLADLGLTVVTQPGFVAERGDRYLRELPPHDLAALYPCASLLRAGVKVAGSTDAPYTKGDVWAAMAAAQTRNTRAGARIGARERVPPHRALELFMGCCRDPGGLPRRVATGAAADLCVLDAPVDVVIAAPSASHVRATVIAGQIAFARDAPDFSSNAA